MLLLFSANVLVPILVLGCIGVFFALVLFWVAQKFKVEENPLIDEIADLLPGANCGGCGKAGCRAMAECMANQGNLDGLHCSAASDEVHAQIAELLGCSVEATEPMVAVVRCATCFNGNQRKNHFEGLRDCSFAHSLYAGETQCTFGCLGLGSCAAACQFGALTMDPETGAPKVDSDKCVACGACVTACPRKVIELRKKGPKDRRMYVMCVNKEKGANARKTCAQACIGCGLCAKTCPFGAITVTDNVAYIDFNLCRLCRKCESVCPTGAIQAVNFPPKPATPKAEKTADAAPKADAPKAEPAQTATPEKTEAASQKQE